MISHNEARSLAREALVNAFGVASDGEVKALAAVACIETSYGDGWRGAGKGSFNMGAIQCGKGWTGERFSYVDTHPNADGTSTRYQVDFRKYPSAKAGFADLVQMVFVGSKSHDRRPVRSAAQGNDWYGVSKTLHQSGYYEGFGKTIQDRIANHYRALSGAITRADGSLPAPSPIHGEKPTLRKGDRGPAVVALQQHLGSVADGIFGPVTDADVRHFQSCHGLVADGVCGPKTWAAIDAEEP